MIAKLKLLLVAALAALGGCVAPAHAKDRGYVAEADDVRIVFAARPCRDAAVLERIRPEFRARFQAGEIAAGGDRLTICWLEADGVLHFIAAHGLPGAVPKDAPGVRPTNAL